MKLPFAIISVAVLSYCAHPSAAQTAQEVFLYDIPANATKVGPAPGGSAGFEKYTFTVPGHTDGTPEVVATESWANGIMISKALFKNGKKYGVQRRWYPNGKRKSEEPYWDGLMDGRFRYWDRQGHLVGLYQMRNGTGTARKFDSDGFLVLDQAYAHNRRIGLGLTVDREDGWFSLDDFDDDHLGGRQYNFNVDGSFWSLDVTTRQLKTENAALADIEPRSGYTVRFDKGMQVVHTEWTLLGKVVSEEAYEAAAKKDGALPVYYKDPMDYVRNLPRDVTALKDGFLAQAKVKIPLEFDNKGNEVLAEVVAVK